MHVELGDKTVTLNVDEDLALDDDTLGPNMCGLAQTIGRYAELMGEAHAYAANKKYEMEMVEANADQRVRMDAKAKDEKVTEPAIKQRVTLDPQVGAARRAYYAADGQHKTLEGLYRALRDKGNLAIALCYKQKEEIRVTNGPLG